MKFFKIIPLIFFIFFSIECQSKTDSIRSIGTKGLTTDSLQSPPGDIQLSGWYESKSMPWVASIFIGVLTVVANLIISHYTRSTSLKVVRAQIENSSYLANVQFQATLNSKNRQDWINEVRNAISEFATHIRQLNIQLQEDETDKAITMHVHEKVYLFRSKIKLLLSPKIGVHLDFLNAQEELMDVLEDHILKSKRKHGNYDNQNFIVKLNAVVDKGREMLYFEWQKIQNAKFDTLVTG